MATEDALPGLAERVRARRMELNLTREQLAERAGCTYSAIAGVENGSSLPSLVLAVRLAEALETTIDHLAIGRLP